MTVARDTGRRGGQQIAAEPPSAAAAAQARSLEIQRQLNLSASEKKHFELVCEVKPDWNDSEIVAFLSKCNYNSNIINDALMNAFEDLRPSEDQNAADWNVQSKKSKRGKKEKSTPVPGESSTDRRRSGPRDRFESRGRNERPEQRDRPDRHDRREFSERRDRRESTNYERRSKWDAAKPEGTTSSKQTTEWAPSAGSWGEAQSTLPADGWGDPIVTPSEAEPVAVSDVSAPPTQETTSAPDIAAPAETVASPLPSAAAPVEPRPTPSTSTISWAGITKRGLSKPSPVKAEPAPKEITVAEPEPKPVASDGWGAEEPVGQWGSPEPALSEDVSAEFEPESAEATAPESVSESGVPEQVTVPAEASVTEAPTPPAAESTKQSGDGRSVSAEDLLAVSEPVILPQFVSQQAAALSTMIQFGSFSISDEADMVSPNAECVRIHSAHADFVQHQQQHLMPHPQPEHEIGAEEMSAGLRGRHDYVNENAMPMHQFYPPFLNNMHSYMPYDADTSSMPAAFFEPYTQQQQQPPHQQQQPPRVQRPRQASYNNARNNKLRRDHRNVASNARHLQPDEFPAGPLGASEPSHSSFGQGAPDRDAQGSKQAGMEPSARPTNSGGSRNNKQRQSERGRGGINGPYHHPSYAGGHIPVGYGQPYGYPAPYLPQFYGQNQQGYGPPGFRQHYTQYQNTSSYQQPYQPRSPYMGQSEYVEPAGMHQANAFGQHQGESGPVSKSSEADHVAQDPAALYPFEHQAWPDQHRYLLQQQQQQQQHQHPLPQQQPQQQQKQAKDSNVSDPTPEGGSLPQQGFERRGDRSPPQSASFGYGGQQYSQSPNYPNFSNPHQYNDNSSRSYPHWASHQ